MKTLLCFIAIFLSGCTHTIISVYQSTGEAPHSISAVQTHFGKIYDLKTGDKWNPDVAFIPASDIAHGSLTKYLLIALPRIMAQGEHAETQFDYFDFENGASVPDSDAHELLSILAAIQADPQQESILYHFASRTKLYIEPEAITSDDRGHSAITTGLVSEPVWITTFDLTFHSGVGTLTLTDGNLQSKSISLNSSNIAQMRDIVRFAVSDM